MRRRMAKKIDQSIEKVIKRCFQQGGVLLVPNTVKDGIENTRRRLALPTDYLLRSKKDKQE